MFNRDQFNNANPYSVAQVSLGIADVAQKHRAPENIIGAAYFFLLICKRYGVDPQDAFTVTKNLLAHGVAQRNPALIATQMFVENDIDSVG